MTTEEIGRVTLFAGLGPAEHEQASRVAADISLRPASTRRTRAASARCSRVLEGRIEPVKLVDGIERVVGGRHPGDIFGEVPIVLGTVFPVGFRAAEPSRVMRLEPHDYHAARGRGARHREGGRQAGRPPHGRVARAPGHRGGAAAAARDRRRAPLGRVVHRAAALPGPQPGHVQVADARRAGRRGRLGRPAAGRRRPAGDPGRRRQDRGPAAAAPGRRAARARHRGRARGVRHRDRRRRARRASPPPCTARRRACARSSSSARRPAARPARRRGSRTTSASRRACRATSWPAARCSRRAGSAPRSS